MAIAKLDALLPADESDLSLGAGEIRSAKSKINEIIDSLDTFGTDIATKFSVFYDAVYWDVTASPIEVTVPAGCTKMHLLSVRGGCGGGGSGSYVYALGGNQNGGNGSVGTAIHGGVVDVVPGEKLSVVLGAGGAGGVASGSGTGAGQSGTFTKIIRTSDSSELVAVAGGAGGIGFNGSDGGAVTPVPPVTVTPVPTVDANKAAAYSNLFGSTAGGGSGGVWAVLPGGLYHSLSAATAGKNGHAYIRFTNQS